MFLKGGWARGRVNLSGGLLGLGECDLDGTKIILRLDFEQCGTACQAEQAPKIDGR